MGNIMPVLTLDVMEPLVLILIPVIRADKTSMSCTWFMETLMTTHDPNRCVVCYGHGVTRPAWWGFVPGLVCACAAGDETREQYGDVDARLERERAANDRKTEKAGV